VYIWQVLARGGDNELCRDFPGVLLRGPIMTTLNRIPLTGEGKIRPEEGLSTSEILLQEGGGKVLF